jgi:hypothetical protein
VGPDARSASSAWRSEIFELLGARQPVKISVPYLGSETVLLVHVEDVAQMLVALGGRSTTGALDLQRAVRNR